MNDNLKTIGVAGLGLLGRGIAACCLAHGFRVIAFSRRRETHDAASSYIARAIEDLIERAGFPPSLRDEWSERYTAATSFEDFAQCDLVIESVIEDLEVKQVVFDQIEAVVRSDVPIASNTSSLPIALLQVGRKHPDRFMGMHWAEPSHATRFMELIRGPETSESVFQTVAQLARQFGKDPSLVQRDVPAFIANRIGYAMYREAVHLLETGVADVETIDRSCRNAFGLWAALCGPFRMMDLTGGPALYGRIMAQVVPSLNNDTDLSGTMKAMIERDASGVIDGHGFYEYAEGEREVWEERHLEHAWKIRQLLEDNYPLTQT
jgi:3-hydroxybutyryl-CoA dehydrogenase